MDCTVVGSTHKRGGRTTGDGQTCPAVRSPADAFLTRTRPAFSLLPSFWALPSFSLPLQGPSDLRLCPSVRWSFPTCSAIQAVPPLSVVPAGGPALALVPFLSPSKSQIKGKEGKAEDARRKESQMEHGPHLSLRWAARGSERAGMAESRKEGPSETGRKRRRKEEGDRHRPADRPTACGPGKARLLLLSSSHVLRAATARRARGRGTIITLYKKCVFARSVGRRPPLDRPLTSFVGDARSCSR